jgi:insecticidal toxin complex protein TccC
LYYFNARYYSPELGRFVSRDPIGIVDDVNLYVYVGNNPLKFVDPTGLKAKDLFVKTYDEFLDLESKIFNWD